MQLNRESMEKAFHQVVNQALLLPEIAEVNVRDVVMEQNADLQKKIHQAMDAGWHDVLSDVDICVVVRKNPKESISEEKYMHRLDRFGFGAENCLGRCFVPENKMARIITREGMRYDFGFSFQPDEHAPLWQMEQGDEPEENRHWPLWKEEAFWFVQVQALAKLYRRDYLIADHLAHVNLNETLVQQMVLRDMQKGTCHHRYGDGEAAVYEKYLSRYPEPKGDERFCAIARKLYAAAMAYDELIQIFYPQAQQRSSLFLKLWNAYDTGMTEKEAERMMYCEHCQKLFAGDVCPDCQEKGREPEETDVCFLTERSHPWSDMLVDVLKQADIPCLRQGSLGAGMMMMAGAFLDMESLYVLYRHLEKAREIMNGMLGEE